jgi:hypothetical protein
VIGPSSIPELSITFSNFRGCTQVSAKSRVVGVARLGLNRTTAE